MCYNNIYVIPTFHLLLHGVVKTFWKRVLTPAKCKTLSGIEVLNADDKSLMKKRGKGFSLTDDQGGRYACILKHVLAYHISDWITWTDVWAPCILLGITLKGEIPTP